MRRYGKQLDSITKKRKPEEDKWIEKTHKSNGEGKEGA